MVGGLIFAGSLASASLSHMRRNHHKSSPHIYIYIFIYYIYYIYIYILSSDSCCKGWAKPARNLFSLPLWVIPMFGWARSNVIELIWGGQQKTIKRPCWWLLSPIFFLLRQFLTAVAFVIMMVSCSTILKFLIREAGECPGFCYPPGWWFH